jgi:DNA-binding IclR family transcriptional regulator
MRREDDVLRPDRPADSCWRPTATELGLAHRARQHLRKVAHERGIADAVLAAVGVRPCSLGTIQARCRLSLSLVVAVLGAMEHHGFVKLFNGKYRKEVIMSKPMKPSKPGTSKPKPRPC